MFDAQRMKNRFEKKCRNIKLIEFQSDFHHNANFWKSIKRKYCFPPKYNRSCFRKFLVFSRIKNLFKWSETYPPVLLRRISYHDSTPRGCNSGENSSSTRFINFWGNTRKFKILVNNSSHKLSIPRIFQLRLFQNISSRNVS